MNTIGIWIRIDHPLNFLSWYTLTLTLRIVAVKYSQQYELIDIRSASLNVSWLVEITLPLPRLYFVSFSLSSPRRTNDHVAYSDFIEPGSRNNRPGWEILPSVNDFLKIESVPRGHWFLSGWRSSYLLELNYKGWWRLVLWKIGDPFNFSKSSFSPMFV